jgi:hypothetical protein
MKTPTLLLLSGLLLPVLAPRQKEQDEKPEKKIQNPVTRFFKEQSERLTKEVEGSWALIDYMDPTEAPIEDAAQGFATFSDGFLTLMISIDTFEERLFRAREFMLLQAGAFRYRFDEQGTLQLANVMSVTNQTEDGDLQHEPSGMVYEYFAAIEAGVLQLRDVDGVQLSFRRVTAGDFPESAVRKLESRRGGAPRWEENDPTPR